MPYYRCMLRGENFPGHLQSVDEMLGFYTNCFIEASDPDAAVRIAMEQVIHDSRFTLLQELINTNANSPTIYIDRMNEIDQMPSVVPPSFIWYPMGS